MKPKAKPIDEEIERLVSVMSKIPPTHKRYTIIAENLRILTEARSKEPKESKLEWNIILPIIGQIFVTGMVIRHEQFNVIASRVGTFWRRF